MAPWEPGAREVCCLKTGRKNSIYFGPIRRAVVRGVIQQLGPQKREGELHAVAILLYKFSPAQSITRVWQSIHLLSLSLSTGSLPTLPALRGISGFRKLQHLSHVCCFAGWLKGKKLKDVSMFEGTDFKATPKGKHQFWGSLKRDTPNTLV